MFIQPLVDATPALPACMLHLGQRRIDMGDRMFGDLLAGALGEPLSGLLHRQVGPQNAVHGSATDRQARAHVQVDGHNLAAGRRRLLSSCFRRWCCRRFILLAKTTNRASGKST